MRSPALRLVLLALVAVAASACGYRFVAYPANSDASQRVAVRALRNDSSDPGLELVVGDALRGEFARRGALHLVDDADVADVVIEGRIARVETDRRSFSSVVLAVEYEVSVELELDVQRRGEAGSLFDRELLRERELYLSSADVEVQRKNRREALRRLANLLAARIHDTVYELRTEPAGP